MKKVTSSWPAVLIFRSMQIFPLPFLRRFYQHTMTPRLIRVLTQHSSLCEKLSSELKNYQSQVITRIVQECFMNFSFKLFHHFTPTCIM
ncbi:hypothetical protein T01_9072 [Trichinella spiralis]|uniref:Uncharacterized protein n=1 Tax=Trichinella spiralis TaxID=6334 RepID=A0A0V1BHP6_TRISP|nr:hypothetical protein T01_9072 [Trichinella spiralis]